MQSKIYGGYVPPDSKFAKSQSYGASHPDNISNKSFFWTLMRWVFFLLSVFFFSAPDSEWSTGVCV
jgi:hypothetical protein